ncbi:ATP-binding protein [Paenibacillus sp. OV219]|uniref:ATP-binding protein n=1 Tax=Paenibacillus sp. OV219 TaxID=1884377 RepID=UPI0008B2C81E|nr:ATP-binding protein [Paenibacillus sp. OV219]SEM63130.1 AAA ATPase domain-containing protein [Paenibacillus sp. OV219]
MKLVRQVLSDLEQKRFVGREKELDIMKQKLNDSNDDWCLIHICGPGGIGKSALLRAFQWTAREELVFFIDGRSFTQPIHFVEAVRLKLANAGFQPNETEAKPPGEEEAELINQVAQQRGGIVLLLDSMERWGAALEWLFDKWLPLLTVRVKVCTAGKHPLDEGTLSAFEWSNMYRNMRLAPLNRKEMEGYLITSGINDPEVRYAVEQFSGGIPLALSLTCSTVLKHGVPSFLGGDQTQAIIASMDRKLFQGEEPLHIKKLLRAASIPWRFDQDMLQWIIGEEITQEQFNEFCNIPYIKLFRQGGYCLLDAVSKWMNAELAHRAPETHALYKQRALAAIERRWTHTSPSDEERKKLLRLEKAFLMSDEFMRSFYFATDRSGFRIDAASKEHIPLLRELVQQFFLAFPPFQNDDTLQHTFLDAIWEEEPSSFRVVYHDQDVAGIYTFVPLNEITRPIFAANPVFVTFIQETQLQEKEYLIWILGVKREFEPELSSVIVQEHFSTGIAGKLVSIIIPIEGPLESICRLGFERIPWADYISAGGIHWKAARIDLRNDELFHRIPGICIRMGTGPEKPDPPSKDTWFGLVKQALECFHSLGFDLTLVKKLGSLLPDNESDNGDEPLAACIARRITVRLERMAGGRNQEKLQARILQLFYIEGIGSHETVATRLGLAMTTYYRYLKKGIGRLGDELLR